VKIFCKIAGKNAVVVGYGPGRKGKPRAIVICEGKLRDVALRDIELEKPEISLVNDPVRAFKKKEA
jgi:hypothetical protein